MAWTINSGVSEMGCCDEELSLIWPVVSCLSHLSQHVTELRLPIQLVFPVTCIHHDTQGAIRSMPTACSTPMPRHCTHHYLRHITVKWMNVICCL